MGKKTITIYQEPVEAQWATAYGTRANAPWIDTGQTRFFIEDTRIGNPPHFIIYEENHIPGETKRICDIGHGLEDASQKAYKHALESAKHRVELGKERSGEEIELIDETERRIIQ